MSYIPTPEEVRPYPVHCPHSAKHLWSAWWAAADALIAERSVDNVEAVDDAWRAFMAEYTRPASARCVEDRL